MLLRFWKTAKGVSVSPKGKCCNCSSSWSHFLFPLHRMQVKCDVTSKDTNVFHRRKPQLTDFVSPASAIRLGDCIKSCFALKI